MNRKIPLVPSEGWLTVGLLTLICLTMAWAIDDSRWVLGQDRFLDFLPLAAIGGVLVGFIGALFSETVPLVALPATAVAGIIAWILNVTPAGRRPVGPSTASSPASTTASLPGNTVAPS